MANFETALSLTHARSNDPVLVPLDGSPLAETALPWAVVLARKWSAPLLLARVVERDNYGAGSPAPVNSSERELEVAAGSAYLHNQATTLRAAHPELTVYTELAQGDPTITLLEMEQLSGARLAVLTTHGRTGLARWARGNVAEKITRHGVAPVLLVRPWDQPEVLAGRPADGRRGLRVVVPLDGSSLAQGVLPLAIELAAGDGGELIFTAMIQTHPEQSIGAYYHPRIEGQRQEANHYLDRLCGEVRAQGVSARSIVGIEHDVAGAIIDVASTESADLIALSTHGRGTLGRMLNGSIADRVAHAARVPVLLYRPPVQAVARDAVSVDIEREQTTTAQTEFKHATPELEAGARLTGESWVDVVPSETAAVR